MIKRKDVVIIKIPFPDISSDLAVHAHMYVCREIHIKVRKFVKCQSFKPYMLAEQTMRHYIDEPPDISRNPFAKPTRIDCDKEFFTKSLLYSLRLRTSARPDVCEDVIQKIDSELICDGFDSNELDEAQMTLLNPPVIKI